MLPKEKITDEIAELRGVEKGRDALSPASHIECKDPSSLVLFIKQIQTITELPVGIKLCIGHRSEFSELVNEMKTKDIFPDFITIDGGEGGTGAAPKSFMDDVGLPIFKALPIVDEVLKDFGVRKKLKVLAAGKLITPSRQFFALCQGADAIYTARGFLLSIGCIQALQCNENTCPAGITSHKPNLQRGLDIEDKSKRVENYIHSLKHDHEALLCAMGLSSINDLNHQHLEIL
jgi:glutamate synthase domain-containing protein 2